MQRALPRNVVTLAPLSAACLRRTLGRMKVRTATGVDAWTVAELRSLPDWSLQRLADALNSIEAGTQEWPHSTLEAWVSLIPKTENSPLPEE